MPEQDFSAKTKEYYLDVPHECDRYFLKGSANYDWGMKNRLARIFEPAGRTVMLAVDHGYFLGPTSGLERGERPSAAAALRRLVDVHARRAALTHPPRDGRRRSCCVSPAGPRSSGSCPTSTGHGRRGGAPPQRRAVAVQVFIGGEQETQSLLNITKLVDAGQKVRHPGARGDRGRQGDDARRALPRPRLPDRRGDRRALREDVLLRGVRDGAPRPGAAHHRRRQEDGRARGDQMACNAMRAGAAGVDMGRNIFQSDCPVGMIRAVRAVVHDGASVAEAFAIYEQEKSKGPR